MEEITVEGYHAKKKTRLSGSSADCFALTILPAFLKGLSDGTEVAMTPRYFCATVSRWGCD